jgi:malonyl-CoA/methylmalonyl-CoA synthetase
MSRPSPLLARWRGLADSPRVAVVDVGAGVGAESTHSFRAIDVRAHRVASVLLSGKGGHARASLDGARVAVLVSPGAAWLEAFYGVLLAGGCVVVLSPLHPAPETAYFLEDSGAETLIVSPDLEARVAPLSSGRTILRTDDLRAATVGSFTPAALAEDAALQLYTSGTTGKPKGAVITHDNLAVQQALLGAAWGWNEHDTLVHALPLHHLHGLGIALLTALGAGAAARMHPHFDAVAVWESMASATVFMAVPTMYTRLFAAFDAADAATRDRWSRAAAKLRLATSGSAALPVTVGDRWKAITGRYPLERFGMTEIGVGMTNPLDGERRPGTVGLPLPSVEARIVGDDGHDAASGELWIRGPSVFSGYHGKDDATKDAFVDGTGSLAWFRTGDTVTRDAAGYFKILGRTSVDILKSGGYKLSALEIEEVLREHAAVAEVAVVGMPDEAWGDRVVACVIPRAGQEALCTEDLLRAFCKERLASYKVPKQIVLVADLPRNAVGKVVKPELVKRLTRP